MSPFLLGKKPVRHDSRTLKFGKYVRRRALPPLPRHLRWGQKVSAWGMMGNDRAGDCTIAAAGHLVEVWTSDAQGTENVIPDGDILAAYSAVTGEEGAAYDPKTGANDNGCVVLDVLNYWRKQGIGGHQIDAYVQLDLGNQLHFLDSIYLFGGCYLGVSLPLSAQAQYDAGHGWAVLPTGPTGQGAPGSWGGHAVPAVGYDTDGLTVVTWGGLQHVSWAFLHSYCDEAYAVLSPDWLLSGRDPSGFDLPQLQQDLSQL